MSVGGDDKNRLSAALASLTGLEQVLSRAASETLEITHFSRCRIQYLLGTSQFQVERFGSQAADPASSGTGITYQFKNGNSIYWEERAISVPVFFADVERECTDYYLRNELLRQGIKSFGLISLHRDGLTCGALELASYNVQLWHREEIENFLQLAEVISRSLAEQSKGIETEKLAIPVTVSSVPSSSMPGASSTPLVTSAEQSTDTTARPTDDEKPATSRYDRMAELGRMLLIRTDPSFRLVDVLGNCERVLGVKADDLRSDPAIWSSLLHASDLRRLSVRARQLRNQPGEFSDEVRLIVPDTGEVRWLMLKGAPSYSPQGEFVGWEGMALDITEKRRIEQELVNERRRIQALYEVSRSGHDQADSAMIMIQGFKVLLGATNAESGIGCLYDSRAGQAELVSVEGSAEDFVKAMSNLIVNPNIVRDALDKGEAYLIDDVHTDPRTQQGIPTREDVRSAIIAPCVVENRVLGLVALFHSVPGRFSSADFNLVTAAAHQLGLSARQAELFHAERRQADSLSALYRLSHELSKQLTPTEVAEHAFAIIQTEMSCKRLWFGVTNEQCTHIVGQAGYGPGVRRHIVDLQIELDLPHDFLDEALRTRQPVVVEAGQKMECSGLNRIMAMLNPGTFVIVPLVALGQLVGLLVVEPSLPAAFFSQKRLPLLSSMASEIATVVLARRFESRMAEADKMRMAGLLASGVAHNFNNLLQAVMGQASLLDMQLPKDSPMLNSTRMILSAANKGAQLIKQLLNFSARGPNAVQNVPVNQMLRDSGDLYRTVLGPDIALNVKPCEDEPVICIDYGQIQQVISNLLVNAKDAIGSRKNGEVRIVARKVRLRSGEIDPELAPGAYVRIDVEDNGAGMDAEHLSRCFEPFFTTKNVDSATGLGFGGFGLGLSSAYSILKHHQGLITASSTKGDGAVFSLFLPEAVVAKKEEVKEKLTDRFDPEQGYVLLINIDPTVAFSMQSKLQSMAILSAQFSSKEKQPDDLLNLAGELAGKRRYGVAILDLDRSQGEIGSYLEVLRKKYPQISLAVVGSDKQKLQEQVGLFPSLQVLERPVDVWKVPLLLRQAAENKITNSLSSQMELDRNEPFSLLPDSDLNPIEELRDSESEELKGNE